MTYSFSNPMYAVSNNKVGGNYELNVVNSTAQYLFAHNYSSYYKLLIAEDKNAIPKFYYFLISNSSATNFTTNICYKIMPSPTCVPLVNLPTQVMAANVGEYGTIAILHTNKATNTTTLSLIHPNGTIYFNLTKNFLGSVYYVSSTATYVAFAIDRTLYCLDTIALT